MSQQTEAYPWRCLNWNRINKKLAITCAKCYAHWTSGIRHSTEPKNMSSSQSQWQPWQEWTDTNADWTWQDQRSGSRRPSRKPNREASQRPRSASPRQRNGKGKNATKGKGTGGKQADAQNYPAIPKAMQPFGGTNSAVDHIIPGGATCSTNANVSGTGSQIQAQNQELVNALRKAYPNMETTPTDVKELIENRAEPCEVHHDQHPCLNKSPQQSTETLARCDRGQAA